MASSESDSEYDTTVDLDTLFAQSVCWDDPGDVAAYVYHITIHLKPSPRKVGVRLASDGRMLIVKNAVFAVESGRWTGANVIAIDWTPATHMRDFDVQHPMEDKELTIARHQGICVLLSMPLKIYLKLYYRTPGRNGSDVEIAQYASLKQDEVGRAIINTDLVLGYEVLVLEPGGDYQKLCELPDKRDRRKTRILRPEFEDMATYDPCDGDAA